MPKLCFGALPAGFILPILSVLTVLLVRRLSYVVIMLEKSSAAALVIVVTLNAEVKPKVLILSL